MTKKKLLFIQGMHAVLPVLLVFAYCMFMQLMELSENQMLLYSAVFVIWTGALHYGFQLLTSRARNVFFRTSAFRPNYMRTMASMCAGCLVALFTIVHHDASQWMILISFLGMMISLVINTGARLTLKRPEYPDVLDANLS